MQDQQHLEQDARSTERPDGSLFELADAVGQAKDAVTAHQDASDAAAILLPAGRSPSQASKQSVRNDLYDLSDGVGNGKGKDERPASPPPPPTIEDVRDDDLDVWASFSSGKKKKKKAASPPPPPTVQDAPDVEDEWAWAFTSKKSKKDKKKKRGSLLDTSGDWDQWGLAEHKEEEPVPEPVLEEAVVEPAVPEPEPEEWAFPSKKSKKGKKAKARAISPLLQPVSDVIESPDVIAMSSPLLEPAVAEAPPAVQEEQQVQAEPTVEPTPEATAEASGEAPAATEQLELPEPSSAASLNVSVSGRSRSRSVSRPRRMVRLRKGPDDEIGRSIVIHDSISSASQPTPKTFSSHNYGAQSYGTRSSFRGRRSRRSPPDSSDFSEDDTSVADDTVFPEDSSSRPPKAHASTGRGYAPRAHRRGSANPFTPYRDEKRYKGFLFCPETGHGIATMDDISWRRVRRLKMPLTSKEIRGEARKRTAPGASPLDQYLYLPSDFLREQVDREISALNKDSQSTPASAYSLELEWALLCVCIEDNRLLLFLSGSRDTPSIPFNYNYGYPYYHPSYPYYPSPPPGHAHAHGPAPAPQAPSSDAWYDDVAPSPPPAPASHGRPPDPEIYGYSSGDSGYPPRREAQAPSSSAYKPKSMISHRYPVSSRQQDSSSYGGVVRNSHPPTTTQSSRPSVHYVGPPPINRAPMDADDAKKEADKLATELREVAYKARAGQDALAKKATELAAADRNAKLDQYRAAADPSKRGKERDIKFKDCVGRKFNFPWEIVRTWEGMKSLIDQAFLHVDVLGPHVHQGRFDLVDSEGQIILPAVWETSIEPGASITMQMWPVPDMDQRGKKPPPAAPPPPPGVPAPDLDEMLSRLGGSSSKRKPKGKKSAILLPPPPPIVSRDMVPYTGPPGGIIERDFPDVTRQQTGGHLAPVPPPPPLNAIPMSMPPPPMPGFGAATNGLRQYVLSQATDSPEFTSYVDMVKSCVRHLPHLLNMRATEVRNPTSGKLSCWDTDSSGGPPVRIKDHGPQDLQPGSTALADIASQPPPNVKLRTIIVEDLTPWLIETIGAAFWVNPEFFEEHLSHSGYQGHHCVGIPPRSWNTNATPKDYISVKWYRPVYRNELKPHIMPERKSLLDPEIGAVEWTSSTATLVDEDGVTEISESVEHMVSIEQNIFRADWPLVTNPDIVIPSNRYHVPSVWEERATMYRTSIGKCPVVIILLDPLPKLRHLEEESSALEPRITTVLPYTQAVNRNSVGPVSANTGVFSKGSTTREKILSLGASLSVTNSTRDDLVHWLSEAAVLTPDSLDLTIVTALLWVIHRDTTGFLHFVSNALEEIGLGSTDDHLMQTRLAHWRSLISRFQVALPELRTSLEAFVRLVQDSGQQQGIISEFIPDTLMQIDILIEQNEKSYAAVRADMAVLESKRAIAEAESVSKITELAFVFIPLTFITGAFSMQIDELQTPAPVYAFVIASILAVGLSYTLRLVVRSTSVLQWKRAHWDRVRKHSNLPPGSQVPARAFATYAFASLVKIVSPLGHLLFASRLLKLFILILLLAALMTPIAVVWAHHRLDVGYKATVTVVVFVCVATVVWFLQGRFWLSLRIKVSWMRFLAGQSTRRGSRVPFRASRRSRTRSRTFWVKDPPSLNPHSSSEQSSQLGSGDTNSEFRREPLIARMKSHLSEATTFVSGKLKAATTLLSTKRRADSQSSSLCVLYRRKSKMEE
ncbi:hypothetical protein NA57DRAFT_61435 [Rhizodiscina lignyota]|uniref:Ubiquitin-like domain-containing protein n=1 Tax=Rhizodiscina lignyota TaxID=1504668 RepID=A0A9P4M3X9_9PEZI|nr:hypothetical protein NA57DRAFT_61435 [Rhizodiscina lignyota]